MCEMNVWPACLHCRWREFEEAEAYGPKGTVYIFECKKAPVCKLIDGQDKLKDKEDERYREGWPE